MKTSFQIKKYLDWKNVFSTQKSDFETNILFLDKNLLLLKVYRKTGVRSWIFTWLNREKATTFEIMQFLKWLSRAKWPVLWMNFLLNFSPNAFWEKCAESDPERLASQVLLQ